MAYQGNSYDRWNKEVRASIGAIVIAFGQLEHFLKLALKRINGKKYSEGMEIAEAISTRPNLCKRIQADYERTVMHQDYERLMEMILEEVIELNKARNAIVHGHWHRRPDKTLCFVYRKMSYQIDVNAFRKLHKHILLVRNYLNALTRIDPKQHSQPPRFPSIRFKFPSTANE